MRSGIQPGQTPTGPIPTQEVEDKRFGEIPKEQRAGFFALTFGASKFSSPAPLLCRSLEGRQRSKEAMVGEEGDNNPCLSKNHRRLTWYSFGPICINTKQLQTPRIFHTRQVNILNDFSLWLQPPANQNESRISFFSFCLISNLLFMRCGVYKGLNQMNVIKNKKKTKTKKT